MDPDQTPMPRVVELLKILNVDSGFGHGIPSEPIDHGKAGSQVAA